MSSISVVILSEFESRHGGENSFLAVLPHLMRWGVRPIILAPDSGPYADGVRELGVELIGFRRTLPNGMILTQSEFRDALTGELRRISPDLVHANSLAMGRLAGPVASRLNIPGLAHLRDIVRLNRQAVADLNENALLFAVSHATRKYHIAQGISPDKCHVVYNGVDQKVFRFREPIGFLHRELRLPHDAVLVGNIGQIAIRKGQLPLLMAMQQVVQTMPQAHLIVVGKRWSTKAETIEYERKLHELAATPLLQGHIHFLGVRHDVPAIMNELTVLLHGARQEPLGRVLLEAAASQVPVIATNVGGTSEIFEPLEPQQHPAAILIRDIESKSDNDLACEFAQYLTIFLTNRTLQNNMTLHAKHIIDERFVIEKSANFIYSYYTSLSE